MPKFGKNKTALLLLAALVLCNGNSLADQNLNSKINSKTVKNLSINKNIQNIFYNYCWNILPTISLLKFSWFYKNIKSKVSVISEDEINKKDNLSDELLKKYLKSPVIPEDVKKIISNVKGSPYMENIGKATYKDSALSSDRNYPYDERETTTKLEKELDKLIDNGLLHLKYTTEKQLDRLIKNAKNGLESDEKVRARFYDAKGVDASDFFKYKSAENSMAVVCSQYNALESCDDYFSPVNWWPYDRTQGPILSLSALVFAKLRESSYLKGKLNDAIDDVLGEKWINKQLDNHKLYSHGYLNLRRAYHVLDENEKKELTDHIEKNINKFKLNFQWVLCNDGKTPMIQIFAAAPSIQPVFDDGGIWYKSKDADKKGNFYNPICEAIQVNQMKMIGKLAKLRRIVSGKLFALHLWLPGGRSFQNHPSVLKKAAEALIDEVRDVDIDVYFHNRTGGNPGRQALEEKGIYFESINDLK